MDLSAEGYNARVEEFRHQEYPNMAQGVYLDHGGATIYARSLVDSFAQAMTANLWGNPHSENTPAKRSGDMVDGIREKALRFLGADPAHFDLVFVANATAAIKLVSDAFRDLAEKSPSRSFRYGYHREVHTSIIGVRELCGGDWVCFEDDEGVEEWLSPPSNVPCVQMSRAKSSPLGLFAYPGQSNLSGRRLPSGWIRRVREKPELRNTYTLFDAAALAMTSSLASVFEKPDHAPDFTCLSFYKIFGFPDLGALIVRRASGHVLNLRKYFGGGTIAQVSPLKGDRVVKKTSGRKAQSDMWSIHDGLEDGTLPFHSILALGLAIDTHVRLYGSMEVISRHCNYLTKQLYDGLTSLTYSNGSPVVEVHVDDPTMYGDPDRQGATIAFSIMSADGAYVPWTRVEQMANDAKVYIRAGGLCCPGGVSKALQYEGWEWERMFSSGNACGKAALAVIHGIPTGIVRASLGAMTTTSDIQALLRFLSNAFVNGSAATSSITDYAKETKATSLLPRDETKQTGPNPQGRSLRYRARARLAAKTLLCLRGNAITSRRDGKRQEETMR